MFTGVTFNQAMKYYLQGKEVIVLDRNSVRSNGKGYDTFPFEELFKNIDLLADVPAVENPEFKEAVRKMTDGSSPQTEETKETPQQKSQEHSTEPKDCGGGNTEPPKRAKKTKKSIILELTEQGMTAKEIVEITGFEIQTVHQTRYLAKRNAKETQAETPKGQQTIEDNSDRHLCKICAYRGSAFQGKSANSSSATGCEYAIIKGHPRGCSADNCNVFEKGNPKKSKKPLVLA